MTKDRLAGILARYGNPVTVIHRGSRKTVRAFIQPLRRRHRLYVNEKAIPAGYFDGACCLYLGDPRYSLPADGTAVILCANGAYTVVTAEEFFVKGEAVYEWAILRPQEDFREGDYDDLDG